MCENMTIAVSHESRPRKKPNTVIQWPCNPLTLCHFVFQTSLLEKGEEKKAALLWKTTSKDRFEKWEKESIYWPTGGIITLITAGRFIIEEVLQRREMFNMTF